MKNVRNILSALLVLSLFIFVVIYFQQRTEVDITELASLSPRYLFRIALVLIGVFCLKSIIMVIPVAALYITAGAIFPLHIAIIVTCIGLFGEFSLGYLMGNRLDSEKATSIINKNKKARSLLKNSEKQSSLLCFFMRLAPLPVDITSIFFGASGIKYSKFIIFSLLGVMPKLIPFVLMGNAASNPFSKEFLIPFSICVLVIALAMIIYRKYQSEV